MEKLYSIKTPSPFWGEGWGEGMKRDNVERCRNLRKNQTDTERILWSILRNRQLSGTKFRRQFSIDRYILDFYAPKYKLGIEADGGQHYDSERKKKDRLRTKILSKYGVKILRFSDRDILQNTEGVCEVIQETLKAPSPKSSPLRGEEMMNGGICSAIFKKAFTLLEVMLSLFITALLLTILAVVFNTGLRAYRQGKDLLTIARNAQLIISTMTNEMTGALENDKIFFKGEPHAAYFMAPRQNSSALDLCEIGYLLNNNILRRHSATSSAAGYEYPDATVDYDTPSANKTFSENVGVFDLHYFNGTNWSDQWTDTARLPQLVEIRLVVRGEYPIANPQTREFITWVYLPNSTNNQ